jgi:hypothetical protein
VFAPWVSVASHALNPSQLQALGKAVGSDGNLWVALPDNSVQELNLNATGVLHYDATATPTKYELGISANGITLSNDVVAAGANFCVGQDVPFTVSGWPTDGSVIATNFQWTLDGTFVNDQTNANANSSDNYFENQNLLANNAVLTNCWWVSGGFSPLTYQASVSCDLIFTNGNPKQTVKTSGLFTMHRPQIYYYTNLVPSALITNLLDLYTFPQGGFIAKINSAFDGQAGATQLIKGYATNSDNFGVNTTNTWELDTEQFYSISNINPTGFIPVIANADASLTNNLAFIFDEPGIDCTSATALHWDFKDYIRFCPGSPGPNIFVTLGMMNWHIYATAGLSNSVYVLTSSPDGGADSSYTDSTDQPQWINIATGINN